MKNIGRSKTGSFNVLPVQTYFPTDRGGFLIDEKSRLRHRYYREIYKKHIVVKSMHSPFRSQFENNLWGEGNCPILPPRLRTFLYTVVAILTNYIMTIRTIVYTSDIW